MSTPVFHAPAVAEPGLRTVLIGRTRQVLGTQLNQLAAVALVVVGIGGVAFEALRLVEQEGVLGTQWQTLGALYVVLAFVIFFLQPTRPGPRRVNGSAARALVSTGPYRRWLVREAHIPALFTARGYVLRVVALVVVWLGGGLIYVNLLRDWLGGAGTVLPAAWVVLGALGVGVLSTLLLIPGRHQARTRIDEEGQFVPLPDASTAGEPAPQSPAVPVLQTASVGLRASPQNVPEPGAQNQAAPPAQAHQPGEAVPVGPPTPESPTPPPATGQPTFGGRERGRGAGRTVLAVLLAVLLTIAVVVAIVGYLAVGRGEARSPNELGDQLAAVDITCVEYDKIFDERQSKALGCRSDDAQLITITTYGSRPATDEWLEDLCRSSEGQSNALRRGVYIVGEDWIIDMHQLAVPKGVKVTPIAQTSEAIASELGGVATPYDCTK